MKKIALLSLLALCLVRSAHAGLFDDDEARRRIDAIKQQLDTTMQRLDTASRSQLELANNIEGLRADLARLRGQIEVLANEQAQTNKRQQDFYIEQDARLRKLESAAVAQPPKPVEPPPPDAAAESRDYEAAIAALRNGKNVDAALAFRNFIKNYPKSSVQASAHFWAGSAYYQARDLLTAQEYYGKVFSIWPEDPMAPDAMLGLANAQRDAGDAKAASATLATLRAKYPKSDAAKAAVSPAPKKR